MPKDLQDKRRQRNLAIAKATGRNYIIKTDEGDTEKWGVRPVKTVLSKHLLVTGTGRCGTHFMSKALSKAGLDIPHERVGEHGTSSHFFATDSDWYPMFTHDDDIKAHIGERKSDYRFRHIIHMVRDPLKCIHSINAVFRKPTYDFFVDNKIIPNSYDPFEKRGKYWKAMLVYYFVNKYIEGKHKKAIRVRLEDISKVWSSLMIDIDFPELPLIVDKPSNTGGSVMPFFNTQKPITIEKLFETDYEIAEKVFELAVRYGYNKYTKENLHGTGKGILQQSKMDI